MEDWNVESSCQMIDIQSEHSYASQDPDYHYPSGSRDSYSHYNQLGVILFYHPVSSYHLSAAAWTYENPAFGLPFPNQNQHLPSVQSIQILSHYQNVQTVAPINFFPVSNLQTTNAHPSVSDENSANISQIVQVASVAPPYWLSASNVQTVNVHPSQEDADQASRSPSVQVHSNLNIQTATPSYRPVSDLETSNAHPSDSANRSPRPSQLIVEEVYRFRQPESAEEYADAEESDYDSDSDLRGDMLLDIEDLSYEELLELEEQMGVVIIGLFEVSILNIQYTIVPTPLSPTLSHFSGMSLLNERCTICLVEYEEKEDEKIVTLNCNHSYHANCIEEWLLIKKVCPICRGRVLYRWEH